MSYSSIEELGAKEDGGRDICTSTGEVVDLVDHAQVRAISIPRPAFGAFSLAQLCSAGYTERLSPNQTVLMTTPVFVTTCFASASASASVGAGVGGET